MHIAYACTRSPVVFVWVLFIHKTSAVAATGKGRRRFYTHAFMCKAEKGKNNCCSELFSLHAAAAAATTATVRRAVPAVVLFTCSDLFHANSSSKHRPVHADTNTRAHCVVFSYSDYYGTRVIKIPETVDFRSVRYACATEFNFTNRFSYVLTAWCFDTRARVPISVN